MTSIVKGMTLQAPQTFDNFITSDLTSFRRAYTINLGFGSDLATVNIQQGRDTGLSGWVFYRKACTGSALNTGSLCEDPLPEAVLGNT